MFRSLQSPAHWSKDFVEHLRTVHFALIAASAALILLVLSSKQYNAINALVQIEEIIELKRDWSPGWMIEHGQVQTDVLQGKSQRKESNLDSFLDDSDFDEIPAEKKLMQKGNPFYGQILLSKPLGPRSGIWNAPEKRIIVKCLFPNDHWYQITHTKPDWSPRSFPTTLSEFKVWWNQLEDANYVIYVPTRFSSSGTVNFVVKDVGRFVIGTLGSDQDTPQTDLQLALDPEADALNSLAANPKEGPAIDSDRDFHFVAELRWPTYLWIPITEMTRYKVTREVIKDRFNTIGKGEFDQAFVDLSRATAGMTDLELADIKEIVHDDAVKGPEVFEIFGMKFPAGQVTFWGIVLLLCVQLYFLTYLRQLSGKLRAEDPGWDVPWIAMDQSSVAQSLFFFTLIPLPLAALALLAGRRISFILYSSTLGVHARLVSQLHSLSRLDKLEIAILIYVFLSSCFLAISRWRYRPRLDPSLPIQTSLFE